MCSSDLWGPDRFGGDEAVAVGHLDFDEALGVHHVVFADDAVHVEEPRDQGIDFVRSERAGLIGRHRAVDVIPGDGRIRIVADCGLLSVLPRALFRIAGAAEHQVPVRRALALASVADGALRGENWGAFLGRALARRKFFALRAHHHVEVLDFVLAEGRAETWIRALAEGGDAGSQQQDCLKQNSSFIY